MDACVCIGNGGAVSEQDISSVLRTGVHAGRDISAVDSADGLQRLSYTRSAPLLPNAGISTA